MWRQIPTFVKVQALLVAAPVLIMSSSLEVQSVQHQRAAVQAREAHLAQQRELARERSEDREELALIAITVERDQLRQALDAANARHDQDQQKIDDLTQQVALRAYSLSRGSARITAGPAAGGNRFVFGYCTWYVYNLRPIPWLGNAIEWWGNAQSFGFAEGSQPRTGAIMVTRDSWFGHVALVAAVLGDGSWLVNEMNFSCGWNCADQRVVRPGGTLIGFIY